MKDPPSYLVFSKIRVLSWSAAGEAYFNTIRKLAINAVRTGEFSALPHVISQERRMIWVCGVISNHIPPGNAYCSTHCPTQSYAHTFLMHSCPQSIPTKLLICRSNCSHFSSWIQVSLPSTGYSVGGVRNGKTLRQKYAHTQTILFPTPY